MGDVADDMMDEAMEEDAFYCLEIDSLSDKEIVELLFEQTTEDEEPFDDSGKDQEICKWFYEKGWLSPKQRRYLEIILLKNRKEIWGEIF